MEALAGRLTQNYPQLKVAIGTNDPAGFDVVVNATPLGMKAGDPMPARRLAPFALDLCRRSGDEAGDDRVSRRGAGARLRNPDRDRHAVRADPRLSRVLRLSLGDPDGAESGRGGRLLEPATAERGRSATMTAATMHEPQGRHQTRIAAASGWIGSALEYYDFFIYATAASLVFPQMFFPSTNPTVAIVASLATYGVGYVARPIGAFVLGHLRRHPWPQERAARLPVPDGPLDDGGRAAADLFAGRGLGAGPARGPAPDPGFCGRGRNLGGELDDSRARAVRAARLFRELHPAGRAGGADSGGGGVPAAELRPFERGLRRLGMARAVPAQRSRAARRLHHPARGRRDAGVHRRTGASRRAEGAGDRRDDQPRARHAAGRLHGADERHSGRGDDFRRRLRRAARPMASAWTRPSICGSRSSATSSRSS